MIVDLFAGPGGWDEGLKLLGRHADCIGIEWDDAACETASAAGHRRLKENIAGLDPVLVCPGAVDGLIASPPCQSFSTAGKQKGRADKEHVVACAHELAAGFDSRHQYGHLLQDERSLLTVEPLRWALALKPRWLAFEQVPAVLELWSLFAQLLSEHDYQTAVGTLTAEMYGVPQTRKRAFLIASLDGPVSLPEPTHSRYYGRSPGKLDDGVLPWVSMAGALGWGMTRRPSHTVTGGGASTGGAEPFGNGARQQQRKAMDRGEWVLNDSNGRTRTDGGGPTPRTPDEPAFTVTAEAGGQWKWAGTPESTQGLQRPDWPANRPATTIAGDSRVFQPGGHHTPGSQSANAVRVTVEEASVLMGFRPDYPWKGGRTKQFQQIGNAVCPPVGARVLAEAMRLPVPTSLAA